MTTQPQTKITVIHHSADFDGLFCREIARKFLPDAELIGWDFKDPKIPFPSEGVVYVMDLSPDCFIEATMPNPDIQKERLIWIDHHKSSIEKWASDIPGYRIDGVAACRLAWQWFSNHEDQNILGNQSKSDFIDRTMSEPLAVRLAGEYDVWDKRDERADVFQFGLRSRDLSVGDWECMLCPKESIPKGDRHVVASSDDVVEDLCFDGKMLQRYQQANDIGIMHRSFIVQFEGLKFLALTTARCNSLTFASKDAPETGHDALMGFYSDGQKWNVSMYHAKHNTGVDLSAIAVKYGGGGHRGACGFNSTSLPPFIYDEFRIMQLAAISTASIQNTEKSIADRLPSDSPYYSAAYHDVCVAVDREMRERNLADKFRKALEEIATYDDQTIWGDNRDDAADNMLEIARNALAVKA